MLFEDGQARLLLSDVKYDSEGNLKTGYVENGHWRLEIRNGEFLAKDGDRIVTRRPAPEYEIMEIPDSVKKDRMCWAQSLYEQASLSFQTS